MRTLIASEKLEQLTDFHSVICYRYGSTEYMFQSYVHCYPGPSLKSEPQLISSEHWRFPSKILRVNTAAILLAESFVSFEDCIVQHDEVLAFVMLE